MVKIQCKFNLCKGQCNSPIDSTTVMVETGKETVVSFRAKVLNNDCSFDCSFDIGQIVENGTATVPLAVIFSIVCTAVVIFSYSEKMHLPSARSIFG